MNKHIHLIQAFALGMAVLSIPTLVNAATTISVVDPAPLVAKSAGALVSVQITCDFGPGSQLQSLSTARHNWVSKYQAASAGASAITFATDFVDQLNGWACWFHSQMNCSSFARK